MSPEVFNRQDFSNAQIEAQVIILHMNGRKNKSDKTKNSFFTMSKIHAGP